MLRGTSLVSWLHCQSLSLGKINPDLGFHPSRFCQKAGRERTPRLVVSLKQCSLGDVPLFIEVPGLSPPKCWRGTASTCRSVTMGLSQAAWPCWTPGLASIYSVVIWLSQMVLANHSFRSPWFRERGVRERSWR